MNYFFSMRCTSCFFSANPWFVKISPRSINYQGRNAVTKDKVDCQRWDVQTPHDHTYTDSFFLEDTVGEASNYCRQLGGEPWPWCYTTSDPRWDFCGKLELYCGKCLSMALRNAGLLTSSHWKSKITMLTVLLWQPMRSPMMTKLASWRRLFPNACARPLT